MKRTETSSRLGRGSARISALPGPIARGFWSRAGALPCVIGLLVAAPAFGAGSLGSTVFIDGNWNGKQDADEPGIAGVEVRLYGPNQPAGGTGTTTNAQGEYLFSGLAPGQYQVKLPAAQMTGTGKVAAALSTYFGTHGIPASVPAKALATKTSAYLNNAIRQDGDSNGVQAAGYGAEIDSDAVPLATGQEPVDRLPDSTDTGPGIEFGQTPDSNGYLQDAAADADGDMTVDFGVVHQCYDICDIDRNGTIDQSDIDWIYDHRFTAPTPGPGMPGSGSCGGTRFITLDDFAWCQGLKRNQPIEEVAIGNRVWKEVGTVDGKFTPGTDQPLSGVFVTVVNQDTYESYTAKTDANGCYLARVAAGSYVAKILAGQPLFGSLEGVAIEGFNTSLAAEDETTDDNGDQNGYQFGPGGDIETNVFDLSPGSSPAGEASSVPCGLAPTDLPDKNVNETADFAFKDGPPPTGLMSLGSTVFLDRNHNGKLDGSEPVVPGVIVQLIDPLLGTVAQTAVTDSNGNYFFVNLDVGVAYKVRIPAAEMDAENPDGHLARFIRDYYAKLSLGIPTQVPTKALATKLTLGSASDSQIDNDSNGLQAAYGLETVSPAITLEYEKEPVNGTGAGKEYAAGGDTTGFDQDKIPGAADNNGDMTVDFGFVHQCQAICDIDGNGVVDDADLSKIRGPLKGTQLPADKIGAPGTGDCGQTGYITGNDYTWCRAIRLIN